MANRRMQGPRSAGQYENSVAGQQSNYTVRGDYTLSGMCRSEIVRPSIRKGPCIFRPWPALSFEDPTKLVQGRKSLEAYGQSHWIITVSAANFIGTKSHQSTFLLYEPAMDAMVHENRRDANPYVIMYRAAASANKKGVSSNGRPWNGLWNGLMSGDKQGGAAVSPPTRLAFAAGIVFYNGETDYCSQQRGGIPLGASPNDDLTIVRITDPTYMRLMELLDKPVRSNKLPPDYMQHPEKAYAFGDPTGIPTQNEVAGGLIITLFDPTRCQRPLNPANPAVPLVQVGGQGFKLGETSWDGNPPTAASGMAITRYEVGIAKRYKAMNGNIFPADLDVGQMQNVLDRWQFWLPDHDTNQPGLLRFPTIEEQCSIIAQAFQDVPGFLEFCWFDHPEFFTEDVRNIIAARRMATVPGDAGMQPATQQIGYPQQPVATQGGGYGGAPAPVQGGYGGAAAPMQGGVGGSYAVPQNQQGVGYQVPQNPQGGGYGAVPQGGYPVPAGYTQQAPRQDATFVAPSDGEFDIDEDGLDEQVQTSGLPVQQPIVGEVHDEDVFESTPGVVSGFVEDGSDDFNIPDTTLPGVIKQPVMGQQPVHTAPFVPPVQTAPVQQPMQPVQPVTNATQQQPQRPARQPRNRAAAANQPVQQLPGQQMSGQQQAPVQTQPVTLPAMTGVEDAARKAMEAARSHAQGRASTPVNPAVQPPA